MIGSTGGGGDTATKTGGTGQLTTAGALNRTDTTTANTGDKISDTDLFEVLSNDRRRYALHYFMQHADEPVEMGDLSTQVAAWEHGTAPEQVSYDQRKSVHTSLYQYHVPKLDETGIVDYDSQRGVAELTDEGRQVDLYLEAVQGREIPWASYFVLLSVFSVALVAAGGLGVPFFADLPPYTCGGVAVAAFFVSSLVFAYDNRTAMRLGSVGPPPGVSEE